MTEIKYVTGDATDPKALNNAHDEENMIICHICNNKGRWGSGFVVPLGKKYPLARQSYRSWSQGYSGDKDGTLFPDFKLGNVQFVEVEDNIYIANMVAQHDTCFYDDIPPIRYDRVRQCLNKVSKFAQQKNASVHMPRIGCGLAGGTWQVIEGLIKETLIAKGAEVVVYTLDNDTSWK